MVYNATMALNWAMHNGAVKQATGNSGTVASFIALFLLEAIALSACLYV